MFVSLIFAAATAAPTMMFSGFVPPHIANDGVRYRVEAAASKDLPAALKSCGIDDFAQLRGTATMSGYEFAVTSSTVAKVSCLRSHVAADARLEKIDHWIIDAQTD